MVNDYDMVKNWGVQKWTFKRGRAPPVGFGRSRAAMTLVAHGDVLVFGGCQRDFAFRDCLESSQIGLLSILIFMTLLSLTKVYLLLIGHLEKKVKH